MSFCSGRDAHHLQDKNGYIEVGELMGLLSVTKEKLTQEEAREIIRKATRTGDDKISFESFRNFLTSNPVCHQPTSTTKTSRI